MALVNTVCGPVEPESLGRTLMHEHFQFGYPGYDGDRTMWSYVRDDVLKASDATIRKARAGGFRTVFDLTPNECGRDPELLRDIAASNDFTVVCATGYYYEGEGAPAYFKFRSLFSDITAELAELFEKELTEGIGDTGIRAGVMKVGTSKGEITAYEECVLRAAARAQQATGAPIITHTSHGTMGPQQARLLVEAGADPAKVVIGHMCGNLDLEYQKETLAYGVGIGFDRIGGNKLFNDITDDARMDTITELLQNGYGTRIFLSHDSVNHWLGRSAAGFHQLPGTEHWEISRIGGYILPGLADRGCPEGEIDALVTTNVHKLWG